MMWSTLYPPNYKHLSDQLVGNVADTSNQRPYLFDENNVYSRSDEHQCNEETYFKPHSFDRPSTHAPTAPENTFSRETENWRKRCRLVLISSHESPRSKAEQVLRSRRECRRLIQQRYRQKIRNRANMVQITVQQLQNEVNILKVKYDRLTENILTRNTPWKIVAEYFHLFRNGLSPICTTTGHECFETSQQQQQQFLSEAMDPDVMTRIGHGVEAILEIWRSISRRQDGFEITLIRMEHGEQNSLIASTKCSFTLTQSLLFHEFPHNFNENGELSGVAGKLLDRDIVLFSSVHFVWDDVTARMTSMMDFPFQNELLVPFLDLLGNLDDVSKVLGASMKQ